MSCKLQIVSAVAPPWEKDMPGCVCLLLFFCSQCLFNSMPNTVQGTVSRWQYLISSNLILMQSQLKTVEQIIFLAYQNETDLLHGYTHENAILKQNMFEILIKKISISQDGRDQGCWVFFFFSSFLSVIFFFLHSFFVLTRAILSRMSKSYSLVGDVWAFRCCGFFLVEHRI